MTPTDIVTEARLWIGTPYMHQASACGLGTDCLGLLRGLWRVFLNREPELVPSYSEDWAEPQGKEVLIEACQRHMDRRPVYEDGLGDVLVFRMRQGSVAKHLGIQSGEGTGARFIHAYSRHGVVETSFSAPWQRRCVARFAFPTSQTRGA
ncbi:peptidase [Marivita hallyeonensis]|uniref:Putative phage cell wall peptidase, NlpC/P60 family n=1 Tax=Marivita hallyeonensis TaxID=996342 RepID=A0A1M5RNC4_9RHOB|nr:peptidase [Marivita hallyeonensis]SHH27650.1 putative phage cell wall peptidase, NlpC/P60 family [Marivita hallyeonensis]